MLTLWKGLKVGDEFLIKGKRGNFEFIEMKKGNSELGCDYQLIYFVLIRVKNMVRNMSLRLKIQNFKRVMIFIFSKRVINNQHVSQHSSSNVL